MSYVFLENGEIITLDQLHENQREQLDLTNKIGLTELLEKQEIERQAIKPRIIISFNYYFIDNQLPPPIGHKLDILLLMLSLTLFSLISFLIH